MSTWNVNALNQRFRRKVVDNEMYLKQVRARMKERRSYRHTHDSVLAEQSVYEALLDRDFLESPETLLNELQGWLSQDHRTLAKTYEALDPGTFATARRRVIERLIAEFAGAGS